MLEALPPAALVEALEGGIAEWTRGVGAHKRLKGEVDVVVLDSPAHVAVHQLEGKEDSVVEWGMKRLVEGRNVNVVNV